MSIRTVVLSFGVLVLLCGAGVYGVYSYFGRDAQMRASELRYNTANAGRIAQVQAAHAARVKAGQADDAWESSDDPNTAFEEDDVELDDWYAEAGSSEEPFDPAPEDYSYLINDTVPYN